MLFDADIFSCCNESTYYTGHFTLTMFSLSLGNIVMSVELSSAVGCLHKEKLEYARVTFPIKFEGVCRPCYSQQAKCELAQACTLKARRCKVKAPRKHIACVSGEALSQKLRPKTTMTLHASQKNHWSAIQHAYRLFQSAVCSHNLQQNPQFCAK